MTALVHDYLVQIGGAERCLELLAEMFPDAPIYTAIVDRARLPGGLKGRTIHTSFLQRVPLPRRLYRSYLPAYPVAFETFDLAKHDLVISSSSAFAKGVLTPPETCHICYCYTPMRFAWNAHEFARHELRGVVARALFPFVIGRLREWDRVSADRVDEYVAISQVVAQRIRKFYRRGAAVIYPPVETAAFQPMSAAERKALAGGDRDAYLIVSRLAPYKRIDLAIEAFNQLGRPLVILGSGRDAARLRRMAAPNVRFLGRVSDAEVRERLAACRALIWPGEEDFGLVPVEAMAAGRPVVAYGAGGALETVVDGVTGLFFQQQTPDALAAAVLRAEQIRWQTSRLRARAEEFDVAVFRSRFRSFVEEACGRHQERLARGRRQTSGSRIAGLEREHAGNGVKDPGAPVAAGRGGGRRRGA
jgi:glycosyltransferase involved in cell wall biosynthesis